MKKIFFFAAFSFAACLLADQGQWHIETNPTNGNPEAVWSAKGSADPSYEIRYSYLDRTEWAPSVPLTADALDDFDPRLAFDLSGNRNVVWWTDGQHDLIKFGQRPASGASWSSPVTISSASEDCRYPSIVVHQGEIWFSYERINASGFRDVLCSLKEDMEPNPSFVVSTTQSTSTLQTKIHSAGGHLWVDWIDSGSHLGYSERLNGSWISPQYEPYSGESDVEGSRTRIRSIIVGN